MAGVSSLLKSALATQKKIAAQEDSLVAFDWENSAQTYEDYLTYSKFLEDRAQKATDVSDNLTYQNKIRSARRSYTSNELQRQQISIMEGRAGTTDKMEAVKNLYYQAVENGDLNLAQNLYSQYDALTIKLQNEQDAAMKQYEGTLKSGQASAKKAIDAFKNDLTKGYDDVTLPNGQVVTPLAEIARDLSQNGGDSATWEAAHDTLEALAGVIIDQYQSPSASQDDIDDLEEKYGPALADLDKKLTFKVGGKSLTAQDVVNARANEEINNPVYTVKAERNEKTGQTEYKLQENNVSAYDFVRKIDEQGNEYFDAVEGADLAKATAIRTSQDKLFFGTSDQGRGLDTQLTDEGYVIGGNEAGQNQKQFGSISGGEGKANRDSGQSIGNRLTQLGYQVTQNGTTLKLKMPGDNVERDATIQPDGSIRFFGDDGQLLEVSLTRQNLGTDQLPAIVEPGQARVVSPDEISDFGKTSTFGGTLSKESAQGRNYRQSILGGSRVNDLLPNQPLSTLKDFSGHGGVVASGGLQGTSALLQGARFTQKAIQVEQQKQAMLQAQQQAAQLALQSTNNFDLNQTPVQQLANGVLKRQLSVAAPAPTQRIYVAPTPYVPITSVGVAKPSTYISGVSVAPTTRVTVGR